MEVEMGVKILKWTGFVLLLCLMAAHAEEPLEVGNRVPPFSGLTCQGSVWKSADHSEQFLVVYFYPAAMTSGCTMQACAYRDAREDLTANGAAVIGVSGDDPDGLKVFKEVHGLNFTLLSDAEGKIAGAFGVPYGAGGSIEVETEEGPRTLNRGVTTQRWTFVLDKSREIIYRNQVTDPAADSAQVLEVLKKAGSEE
jgi:thioredoxin-dependent peroxiredoxin